MAEKLQSDNLLSFGNKQENNGADSNGRLSAYEFNTLVGAVNNNSNAVFALQQQLKDWTISVMTEEEYESAEKQGSAIYFVTEE